MENALTIMIIQGLLGAFDTIYFHEFKYSLPVHGPSVAPELRLHAFRDFVYSALFITLPFVQWHGYLAAFLAILILLEICITIWDFNVEVIVRATIGGVANSERGLHLIMAVVYGFFLAHFLPHLLSWFYLPSGFSAQSELPLFIRVLCPAFGVAVLMSGIRDMMAARGIAFFQKDFLRSLRK